MTYKYLKMCCSEDQLNIFVKTTIIILMLYNTKIAKLFAKQKVTYIIAIFLTVP